jgi:C4-dicarboxylate-specific signal transduction histidine kinase
VLVEARSAAGVWSSAPAVVELDVLPAWWQTSTARGAFALALVVLGAGGVSLRIRSIERRHAAALDEVERQRQAEQRIDGLRAQLEHVARVALAGELAASIAHEVRQPIGAIVNNAEAGARNLSAYLKQPREMERLLGDIVSDAMRASSIIRGLREFLQPIGPKAGPIDLSALVREALPLVERELRDCLVRVELHLSDALPPIEGSRVQVSQIIVNLVTNAIEALSHVPGDRRLVISTRTGDGLVELTVRDNGPGLSDAVAARVFDPFVTTKTGGLGVGLAISRSIAERHGGRLVLSRAPDRGLLATLSLPLKTDGDRHL